MSRIKILAVGKIKENYILEGINEYTKRMKNRKIEIIEIKDSTKEKEGEEILDKLEKMQDYITVVLDEHGKELTSLEFSQFIKGNHDACFIIGGPDGLSESVFENVKQKVALSRMTFTHEMARLILIEQLYRGFSIIEGKTYHRS